MILTNEKKLAKYAKYLSTQATDDPINYVHNDIGYNFRLTNVQAAVGLAQLEKINYFLKKKRNFIDFIKKNFKSMKNLNFAPVPKYATNNCWMMSVILKKGSDKKKLINYLRRKKIQTRSIWQPCHMQKPYKFFESYKIVNAENLFKRTVNIPCSTNLSLNQARLVIKFIKIFYKDSKMIKIAFFTSTRGDLASLNPIIKEVERTKRVLNLCYLWVEHIYIKIMAIPSKKFKRKTKSLWIL